MLCAFAPRTLAQPTPTPPPEHDHDHSHLLGIGGDYDSLGQALRAVDRTLLIIQSDMAQGGSPFIAHDAEGIVNVARQLGRLSLKPNSGVERKSVREVNVLGKQLADDVDHVRIDAREGNWDHVKPHLGELSELMDKIAAVAPYRYSTTVEPVADLAANVPVGFVITLKDPKGAPVKDLKIVHEMPLHLLVVSSDLSWYAHEHPARQPDGTFHATITFPHPGKYRLVHDFTPSEEHAGNQIVATEITIPGEAPKNAALVLKNDEFELHDIGNGYSGRFRCNADDVVPRTDTLIRFTIQREGKPVTDLQPYLGAMGHLVIFSEDLKHYIHAHPLGAADFAALKKAKESGTITAAGFGDLKKLPDDYADGGKDDVVFHVQFPSPGMYRMFAQFQHNGLVLTLPWTLRVYSTPKGPHEHP
ncbi:MAG TPA: hypothetical protein VG797_08480 [Phycisphaerales bacterium]|nr:hypothetical protein [Phycisphaerales bacterium]